MAWLQRQRATSTGAVDTLGKSRTRRLRRVAIAVVLIPLLALGLASARFIVPLRAQDAQAQASATTFHGADTNKVQQAVNAVKLQAKANWCGVAAIAWVAYYLGHHGISQQQVANYLNSSAAVSPWGTPSKDPYSGGPAFKADIARDSGTDPRSHAVGLAYAAQGAYSQVVARGSARDATNHLIYDVAHYKQPIVVIVDHGLHTVLVSGVYATGDPLTNPGSVTSLVVWDPGNPSTASNIQSSTKMVVSISTWLTSSIYWGKPYDSNPILGGKIILDPDPAVGPYTYDPTHNDYVHLWIGHYVYIHPTGPKVDWALDQFGRLIKGWHGEVPSDYTGPTVTLANTVGLSSTSSEAPGFWSRDTDASSASGPATAMAWVENNSAHNISVSTSDDGFHYANKITLPVSSLHRPSVAVIQDHGMSVVAVAWIGTDSNHTVNVWYDVYGALNSAPVNVSPQRPGAQLGYHVSPSSDYPPALAVFHGHLWLAWVGTDSAHTVNVLELEHAIRTPWGSTAVADISTRAAPALVADTNNEQLLLTWQDASTSHLRVAQSSDGTTWTLLAPLPITSQLTPGLTVVAAPPAGMAPYQWAWVVSSSNWTINLSQGTTLADSQPALALSETSAFTPAIGYVGQPHEVMVVWTGTDPAHHIYVASVPV